MTRERPRTNQLVHGRIYPDDAELLVQTAPPTPEAIVDARITVKRLRYTAEQRAERIAYVENERAIEQTLRDAVALLRTRFILKRR